ncbi:MAG: hypothetical protein DDT25_01241 [Chloroflexi bacterium]|nr:hypothetical protein [Chloroflexota bacterium]
MNAKNRGVHVVTTSRSYKGKTYRNHLLRRSYRENGKVKKETVANLTRLGDGIVELIRRALHGEDMVPASELFDVLRSPHHGHVDAVLTAVKRLGLEILIASRPSRERDLVIAMVVARILEPQSKLATTKWWGTTTLPEMLEVGDATEDDLYAAMDWILKQQGRIEKKLAARHLSNDSMVLYDLTSSYFEGITCPLAALGYPRDGISGKLQVNYGLMTDRLGRPVSVSVFKGNTGDTKTLLPQIDKAKKSFGIERLVLVGDRGMITQTQIDQLKDIAGIDWIGALRPEAIRKLVNDYSIQMELFDERNLFSIQHPDFPGERLVACRNPHLAKLRSEKRMALLEATRKDLEKVLGMVKRGKLQGSDKIGVRVGKVINKHKVAKHFVLDIGSKSFSFMIDEKNVAIEAALDGIYVIRTSLDEKRLGTEDAVRSYKLLAQVERAFRSFKSIDLNVRPIRHRLENRVRAHIFLCMLAYYVQWHMIEAWRPMLFCDEDLAAKETRDPVSPAKRSQSALKKARSGQLESGERVHSFRTLLQNLGALVRNKCRRKGASADEPVFDINTIPNPEEQKAFRLLDEIRV